LGVNLIVERKGIEKRFFDLCFKVVESENLSLYDMEYIPGQSELRVFIQDEKTGTALIEDCVRVDRAFTPYIEAEEWMPESLTLQVSSPGLYRKLRTLEHFQSAVGKMILVTIKKKLEPEDVESDDIASKKLLGEKKFIGKLLQVEDSEIVLETEELKVKIKFENIKRSNLETDIKGL
jgi:ribosome maturation factor RimP